MPMQHIEEVAVQFHWEQQKEEAFARNGWRRFGDEEGFLAWMLDLDASATKTWKRHYLPAQFSGDDQAVRHALARLHPMPVPIRERYDRYCQRDAARRVRISYDVDLEHLLCLASQRLVAFHTLQSAFEGPNGIDKLRRTCTQRMTLYGKSDPVRNAELQFWKVMERPTVLNALAQETVLRRAADLAWVTIAQTAANVVDVEGLEREPRAATPSRLWLERRCVHCYSRARKVQPHEAALPPFHRLCRCFRLRWDLPGMSQFERHLRLWAIDAAVSPFPSVIEFPVADFLETCLRQPPRPKGASSKTRAPPCPAIAERLRADACFGGKNGGLGVEISPK